MADFAKQYIVIEPFYFAEVRESVFNGYPKFKTLVLNIDCTESPNSSSYIQFIILFHIDDFVL